MVAHTPAMRINGGIAGYATAFAHYPVRCGNATQDLWIIDRKKPPSNQGISLVASIDLAEGLATESEKRGSILQQARKTGVLFHGFELSSLRNAYGLWSNRLHRETLWRLTPLIAVIHSGICGFNMLPESVRIKQRICSSVSRELRF